MHSHRSCPDSFQLCPRSFLSNPVPFQNQITYRFLPIFFQIFSELFLVASEFNPRSIKDCSPVSSLKFLITVPCKFDPRFCLVLPSSFQTFSQFVPSSPGFFKLFSQIPVLPFPKSFLVLIVLSREHKVCATSTDEKGRETQLTRPPLLCGFGL